MSDYGRVPGWVWHRAPERDDDAQLLFLYLLTNEHCTTEGLYRLPLGFVYEDLGWAAERVDAALALLEAEDLCNYDRDARVVLVVRALEIQPPGNANQTAAAIRRLKSLPPTFLRGRFAKLAERNADKYLAPAMREAFPEWFIVAIPRSLREAVSQAAESPSAACEKPSSWSAKPSTQLNSSQLSSTAAAAGTSNAGNHCEPQRSTKRMSVRGIEAEDVA